MIAKIFWGKRLLSLKMNIDATKKTFSFMLSNFEAASKNPQFQKFNWDAFPNGYSDLIKRKRFGRAC